MAACTQGSRGNQPPRKTINGLWPTLVGWLDPRRWTTRRRRKAAERIAIYAKMFANDPVRLQRLINKELSKLRESEA